jgi:hypothetical protein
MKSPQHDKLFKYLLLSNHLQNEHAHNTRWGVVYASCARLTTRVVVLLASTLRFLLMTATYSNLMTIVIMPTVTVALMASYNVRGINMRVVYVFEFFNGTAQNTGLPFHSSFQNSDVLFDDPFLTSSNLHNINKHMQNKQDYLPTT